MDQYLSKGAAAMSGSTPNGELVAGRLAGQRRGRPRRWRRALVAVPAAALVMTAACGNDDKEKTATGSTSVTTAPGTTAAPGTTKPTGTTMVSGVTVSEPWARTSPMNAKNGAVYMVLESATDDKLVEASVPPTVAAKVELHETVKAGGEGQGDQMGGGHSSATTAMMGAGQGGPMGGEMGGENGGDMGGGMMQMRPIEAIDLPAGTTVELKPGGLHIMLIDLVEPLKDGQQIELTLTFEKAGKKVVTVPVRES